ncbi:MAG: hypothetical protein ONB44_04105 [candidate division KSB1 bacterium]|nr:hypothetical protein [candidate division KSB1 bacterium]MDZ7301314.1 hypothetical protein [candidate division KSB1 bacterium]MDZ7310801.1 hypothetical protein [candidate division KSB1 bacterium]
MPSARNIDPNKHIMLVQHREIIFMAIFIALAVAGGYIMAQVPNVELITVIIFLGGIMLGIKRGMIIGAVAEFLYSVLNPYGLAAPPLLGAQILSMILVGAAGGLFRKLAAQRPPSIWLLGLAGFVLTFMFDLLTTLAFTVIAGLGLAGFLTAVTVGLYFYIVHEVSNVLIFAILLPILLRHLQQLPILHNALPVIKTIPPPEFQPSISFPSEGKP